MIYLILAYEFFKIGLFSIGGGMATLPFLMDLTNKYDWFTVSELTNMVAISESTPGPVGINMATYAGYNAAGVLGAIVATLALTAPAWIIIILIAKFLENFSENKNVKAAFYGIRPAVAALIGYAVWELLKIALVSAAEGKLQVNMVNAIVCVAAFALLQIKKLGKLHPLAWIAAGACIGVVLKM
ncbi:MAG: chromate transporter [Dorea sp.]|jgi:Chromate transport protein ChrA|nr:chromate transporter [Dorea sp.]MCI9615128.1 chromate transporter [Dorea sp.]GFI49481.1 chromate transport protein [Lachnospiraceae bacterium]